MMERGATVTIRLAGEFSEAGRKKLADWLRSQADMVQVEGDQYSKVFRARYRVLPRTRLKKTRAA